MKNKDFEKVDLLGVLASQDETSKELDKENMFINSVEEVQFYIKLLSSEPYDFPSLNIKATYFSCFGNQLEGFFDDKTLTEGDRMESLKDFLKNRLIKFNVHEKESTGYEKPYYNGTNLKPVIVDDVSNMSTTYHPYPFISAEQSGISLEDLKNEHSTNRWIKLGEVHGISKHAADVTPFVLLEDESNDIYAIGEVTDHQYSISNGMSYNFENGMDIIKVQPEFKDDIIISDNDVVFITNRLGQKLEEELLSLNSEGIENSKKNNHDLEEKEFLKQFNEVLSNKGLVFKASDIVNFHTSVKSSYLTILAGMSGTGKSKIVQAYAKALGLESEFKLIPVSPGWTEDSDLIGYADTLNMIYRASETELVDVLLRAASDKDILYIICLDEMNLAKVEHYFSQFLSVLEADEERRKLTLYNKELQNRIYNSTYYNYEIPIYNNVRFIGTVNIDESTHEFSNKVLDRSNVITLGVEPFQKIAEASEVKTNKILDIKGYKENYLSEFVNRNSKINLNIETIEFLQELHNVLFKVNINFGIGPRIFKQIDNYIKNIPNDASYFDVKIGLDYQIKQRVLTKIRGSREELINLLGSYVPESNTTENSIILEILESHSDLSDFYESKDAIIQKAKEVDLNEYTF